MQKMNKTRQKNNQVKGFEGFPVVPNWHRYFLVSSFSSASEAPLRRLVVPKWHLNFVQTSTRQKNRIQGKATA